MTTVKEYLTGTPLTEAEQASIDAISKQVFPMIVRLGDFLVRVNNFITGVAEAAEKGYDRRNLRIVYRQRHSWKKADLPRLATYRLNQSAQNRIARISASKSRGRPKIIPYKGLAQQLAIKYKHAQAIFAADTPSPQRLQLLKQSRWFPLIAEATYRGESQRIRQHGLKRLDGMSISEQAEKAAAAVFLVSPAKFRKACSIVRSVATTNGRWDSMTALEVNRWLCSGVLPDTFLH